MTMYYSQEDIEHIRSKYELLSEKYSRLMLAYHDHQYIYPLAVEYARHGFIRRIGTLLRCIENTFVAIPLDHIGVPSRDRLSDATINIQAFVFNVFGAVDNLAWIWVTEAALTKKDGWLTCQTVGLASAQIHKYVRNSLPVEFRNILFDGCLVSLFRKIFVMRWRTVFLSIFLPARSRLQTNRNGIR